MDQTVCPCAGPYIIDAFQKIPGNFVSRETLSLTCFQTGDGGVVRMNPNHSSHYLSGGPNLNLLDNMLMAAGFQVNPLSTSGN